MKFIVSLYFIVPQIFKNSTVLDPNLYPSHSSLFGLRKVIYIVMFVTYC